MEHTPVTTRPEPRRRWYWAALAVVLPLAVVGTSAGAAATWESGLALADDGLASTSTAAVPSVAPVTAEGSLESTTVEAAIPAVEVSRAPEPVVEQTTEDADAAASGASAAASSGSGSSTGSSATSESSSAAASSVSPADYCANPSSPYGAGSTAKSLLTAVNKERARLGLHSLGWSSSLATAAQSWSESMAARNVLEHSSMGQENVGYTYNSGGLSVASGLTIIEKAWMQSYGHCTNIMYPGYTVMGAGVALTGDGTAVYATQNFN
ncbi:CAP domain-containing protein [Demequina sp. NBRC 110054]|uniref:CAP domain-containing protein n=1 Tax=Demequina sp. NBRC 110054 TaxID=1570343 RepID=UPI0009FEA755|nr:CAP domain-containing protein [Demequina sp. NBRC 110054]